MKRIALVILLAFAWAQLCYAQVKMLEPSQVGSLPQMLNEAFSGFGVAKYSANLNRENIGSNSNGSIQADSPFKVARDKAKAAYQSWIVGKNPQQLAAGKKLYVAWLTKLDAVNSYAGDPNDVDNMPAGAAYNQALNEFDVDTGS